MCAAILVQQENKMQISVVWDYFCGMFWLDWLFFLGNSSVCYTKQTWRIYWLCLALNRSVTLWASCPLHPLVHPVAQAYSAGEGLSQKPTSTVPAPHTSLPCAPSFIHSTLQELREPQLCSLEMQLGSGDVSLGGRLEYSSFSSISALSPT